MKDRDQARVYAIKLRPRQKTDQPIKELVSQYRSKIKRIRRGKDKNRGALLINLQDCSRMSTLQNDLKEKYIVKQFKKDEDSDQFSSNDVNLQIENEAKDLEQTKIKQEHEACLLKIKQEYEQNMLKVQIELKQNKMEIEKLKLGIEQQNLGVEHQIEQNILNIEHTAEIGSKTENLEFLKKVETLEQRSVTEIQQKPIQDRQALTKKIKKEKNKKRQVKLEIPKSPLRTEESAQNHAWSMREARNKDAGKQSPFSDLTGKFSSQKFLLKQKK